MPERLVRLFVSLVDPASASHEMDAKRLCAFLYDGVGRAGAEPGVDWCSRDLGERV